MQNSIANAFGEAIKEIVRLVLLAIIPVLIMGIDISSGHFAIQWNIVLAVAAVTALRSIDRFLHIYNREEKPGLAGESMGLIKTNW